MFYNRNIDDVMRIIRKNAGLNNRLYTIGIGSGASRDLIVRGAATGYGKAEFIADNDNMQAKIIDLLKDSITPFIENFTLSFDTNIVEFVAPKLENLPLIRKNEALNFFVFLNKEFANKKSVDLTLKCYNS